MQELEAASDAPDLELDLVDEVDVVGSGVYSVVIVIVKVVERGGEVVVSKILS